MSNIPVLPPWTVEDAVRNQKIYQNCKDLGNDFRAYEEIFSQHGPTPYNDMMSNIKKSSTLFQLNSIAGFVFGFGVSYKAYRNPVGGIAAGLFTIPFWLAIVSTPLQYFLYDRKVDNDETHFIFARWSKAMREKYFGGEKAPSLDQATECAKQFQDEADKLVPEWLEPDQLTLNSTVVWNASIEPLQKN